MMRHSQVGPGVFIVCHAAVLLGISTSAFAASQGAYVLAVMCVMFAGLSGQCVGQVWARIVLERQQQKTAKTFS